MAEKNTADPLLLETDFVADDCSEKRTFHVFKNLFWKYFFVFWKRMIVIGFDGYFTTDHIPLSTHIYVSKKIG